MVDISITPLLTVGKDEFRSIIEHFRSEAELISEKAKSTLKNPNKDMWGVGMG
jgi:hypothetical protein